MSGSLMKKNFIPTFAIAMILIAVLGCGLFDEAKKTVVGNDNSASNSNKTLTDKAVDVAVGEKKVGIPECDEVIDILAAEANDPDDNLVTKAIKQTALNQFRDKVKESLEQNKANKTDVAKFCRDFRSNLQNYHSGQTSNKK